MDYTTPSFPVLHYLPEFAQIHLHWVNDAIYISPCHLLLLLPSVFPSIEVFSNELAFCIRWPKYCSFSFSPSNEYSELISFMIYWFDILSAQGTLKSLLQNHSSKAATLCHSGFLMVQLSHPYLTSGETIAWTRQTFVSKMSLLLNTLPRFVIAFLPRSKCLLISWLQSPSIVILEPKTITWFAMMWGDQMSWSSFFECWVLSQLFHCPLSPSSRSSLVPFSLSAARVILL